MAFFAAGYFTVCFGVIGFIVMMNGGGESVLDNFLSAVPLLVFVQLLGIFTFYLYLHPDAIVDDCPDNPFIKFLRKATFVIVSPFTILGIVFWLIGKLFRVGKRKFAFYMTSFVGIIWEAICLAVIVSDGFASFMSTLVLSGGIIIFILMWALGIFIAFSFFDIEEKCFFDYFTLIINFPNILLGLIIHLIGLMTGKTVAGLSSDSGNGSEEIYHLRDGDIYDHSGNRIVGADGLDIDNEIVRGTDGKSYKIDKSNIYGD